MGKKIIRDGDGWFDAENFEKIEEGPLKEFLDKYKPAFMEIGDPPEGEEDEDGWQENQEG